MKLLLATAGLAACTLLAPGLGLRPAAAQAATHVPAQVKDGTFKVEPGHTQIGFTLLHLGFSYYSGVFSGVSGTLVLDKSDPSRDRLDISVPIDGVATTSAKLDGELKGPQWFDAQRFPTARFVSTSVTPTGADSAEVAGTLTLHGVSHPETLSVRFVGAGINPLDKKYTVGFAVTGQITRSTYGVKTYVPLVGDDVKLTIAGAFERQD